MTKSLFQYRPPAAWAYENLCSEVIYFPSPLEFNDPFDCRTPPMLRDLTRQQLAFLRQTNPDVWGITPEDKHLPKTDFIAKVNKELQRRHETITQTCGVACFSRRNDSLLMWSHYAGGGRGFCLEFDGDSEELYENYDVDYSGIVPDAYHYVEALAKKQETERYVELLLTHKNEVWKYEEEVRLFQGKVGKLTYHPKTLKTIYLGSATTNETQHLIQTIAKEKYPHIKLKKAQPGKDRSTPDGFATLRH